MCMMNATERYVLQDCNMMLIRDLDAKDIAPFLFAGGYVSEKEMEEMFEINETRRNICQKFLLSVVNSCPFDAFLKALRHGNQYDFLAQKLEDQLQLHRNGEYLGQTSPKTVALSDGAKEDKLDTLMAQPDTLPQPVCRIRTRDSSHTRKITLLAHKLKTLSHDGNVEKFREITQNVLNRFRTNKPRLDHAVALKLKEADLAFTVLEAEASAKRVKYDVTLYGSDVFKEMESVIPFTSNPTSSSMTYLARYGSAVSMMETLDTGIAHLLYAKHHAQLIEPGKSTGMVYYIEVNLLSQKYEREPVSELKQQILKTAEEAMSHFEHEDDEIRIDYQRMLMLKKAFCHLGIGLFCKLLEDVSVSTEDRNYAKSCLDFIENPEIWKGMEKRRKMLFLVAKSELYRQDKQNDLSRCHAVEAQKLAYECDWKVELANIETLIQIIDRTIEPTNDEREEDIDDLINDLLGGVDLNDYDEQSG